MVRRHLLLVLLLGVLVVGGVALTWQARAQARLVERDLSAARDLLGQAGGFSAGELEDRLVLVDQAEARALAVQRRLGRPPLRLRGAVPLVARDVQLARAVTASAVGTVRSTGTVVIALQPIQAGPPTRASILQASGALLGLHTSLEADLERGPRGTAAAGHRLPRGLPGHGRRGQRHRRAGRPGPEAGRRPLRPAGHGPLVPGLGVDRAWSAVNIPPDMPTVGSIATRLYREATGDRIDGVIALDPLAVAQVLEAGGPIRVDGIRLDADNIARETLVQAYIRYADDNNPRKRFLRQAAAGSFDAFRRVLAKRPVELMQGLATAARGHVQVYSADPAGHWATTVGTAHRLAGPAQHRAPDGDAPLHGPGRTGQPRPDPAGGRARRTEDDHLLPADPAGRGRTAGRRAASLPAGAAAQATIWPDEAQVVVAPPEGWEFSGLPDGASTSGEAATWSGLVDQERELVFLLRVP